MKNKKGLTLVELLAVVVLLGIIALVTLSVVTNLIQKQQEKNYYSQLNQLISAGENWVTDNQRSFTIDNCDDYTNANYKKISVLDLQEEGYLSDKFLDPTTKVDMGEENKTFLFIYKFGKGFRYCVDSPKCNKPKYKENKNKASNLCCNGEEFKQFLQSQHCDIPNQNTGN